MKTNHFLFTFLGSILLGCNVQPIAEEKTETLPDGQSVTVSLGLGGEITVQESPLSRAAGSETTSQDLYGISVYYDKEKDGDLNDAYAYGLFDNVNDMVITLVTGYKYKFICTMVPDGKAACRYSSSYQNRYAYPFYAGSSYELCSNRFNAGGLFRIYRTNTYSYAIGGEICYGLNYGYTSNRGYSADRYYGETSDYSPKEGGKVIIDMKRCAYGLTVNVSGVTKGTATVSINNQSFSADGQTYSLIAGFNTSFSTSKDCVAEYPYISFYDVYGCWNSTGEYSQVVPVRVYWSYTYDGTNIKEEFTKYQAVTIKRNTMTTINLNLNIDTKGQSENGVSLVMDNSTMMNQGYTFNYDIKLDNTVDNPVVPQ